jgi:predicted transcriptional regulator
VGLTVQFDGDVYDRLAELSEKREESIGSLVREAVAAYVKRQKGR